jgi:predicted type IV restriction endonuclease
MAIRQGIVLPLLAQLGWNRDDLSEVVPEFQVRSGYVDHCLMVGYRKTYFVETKRPTQALADHEEQLVRYSFDDGAEFALLANGSTRIFQMALSFGRGRA